jgi:hypothetical protein
MDNAIVQEMGEIADKAYTSYLKGATFTVEDKTYTVIATQADIPEIVANDSGFQGLLLQDNTAKKRGRIYYFNLTNILKA